MNRQPIRLIDRDTFEINGAYKEFESGQALHYGTVVVNFQGRSKRVAAKRWENNGAIDVHRALVGRYRTGKTNWPVGLTSYPDREVMGFGFSSNSGRHHRSHIMWAE